MTKATFYHNNYKGGISNSYTGAQRRSVNEKWDSLETWGDTYLVVWNGNFAGDWMKIGPNTTLNDLNTVDRSSGGDWKNQISSFIMYEREPSWWNDTTAPPTNDLNLAPTAAVFSDDAAFMNNTSVFSSACAEPDLNTVKYGSDSGSDMKNNIGSLATGSSAWLEIWNATNYASDGDYLRIYPNTTYSHLEQVSRTSGGNWRDQIQSFKLHNTVPDATWTLKFDEAAFWSSFPGAAARVPDSSGPYETYTTQGASYDIHFLGTSYPDSQTMNLSFRVDYDLTGKNDKVTLDILVNLDGTLNQITTNYTQGNAVQIPGWVVKAVDTGAEVLGAVGALESAGISEAAANEFVEDFDSMVKIFNKISNVLYKMSEKDDGRYYMVAVVSHVINRALRAIIVSG